MTTRVICLSADGREKVVTLFGSFSTDESACRVALSTLPPDEGWRALLVL